MIAYPRIDPVAIKLGPLKIHWYGLMYLGGFLIGWWLGRRPLFIIMILKDPEIWIDRSSESVRIHLLSRKPF